MVIARSSWSSSTGGVASGWRSAQARHDVFHEHPHLLETFVQCIADNVQHVEVIDALLRHRGDLLRYRLGGPDPVGLDLPADIQLLRRTVLPESALAIRGRRRFAGYPRASTRPRRARRTRRLCARRRRLARRAPAFSRRRRHTGPSARCRTSRRDRAHRRCVRPCRTAAGPGPASGRARRHGCRHTPLRTSPGPRLGRATAAEPR